MTHTTAAFDSGDGLSLFSHMWSPDKPPHAVLAIVHGVTEHGGRYQPLAEALVVAGILVAAFDLRGHGRSGGRRGHVDSWQDYVADTSRFVCRLNRLHPGLPVFLFGHSLGSLIAAAFVVEHPTGVRGLIVSGLAVDPVGVARPHLVALARIFSRLWPTFVVRIQANLRPKLSRDPRVDAAFAADPLVLKAVTARFGTEALALVVAVKRDASRITIPLLGLHGGADPLNTLNGASRFFEAAGSPDKQLIVYPGSLHEVVNDLDREKVFEDIRGWIDRRL